MDKEQEAQEKCPLCTQRSNDSDINDDQDDDLWLQCDGCATWFHTYCLRLSRSECDSIDQFYCESCTKMHGPTTYKPETRKSSRERTRLNYADLNEGNTADQRIWAKLLAAKTFAEDRFPRYSGHEVNLELLNETGMKVPFIVEDPEGLDMKMPSPDTTVRDVAEAVGRDYPVDVIDVATQSEQAGWTMGRWADYYHSPKRDRIRNVISLEITGTDFAEGIKRPRIVREIDWIDHMWPKDDRPEEYPKVQLYCLMGTKDSYTDFHIDFGGSSVFYHVVSGSKIFYFIEPTKTHLKKYQKWSSSSEQSTTFFGDEVKKCYAVHIKAGNTMIIPTGWIHAVYTPEDALVIGGNFLHGYNIETQIRIYEIEQITEVPLKFQFPYFLRMNLYAAMRYKELLEQGATLSHFELAGILKLAKWLRDILENPKGKKSASQGFVPKLSKTDIPPSLQNPKKLVCDLLELVRSKIEEETEAIKRSREEISTEPSQNQIKRVRLMATKPEKSPVKKPLPDETRAFEFLQGRAYEQAILGELEDDDKEIKVVDTTKDDDYTWNGANDGDDDAIYSSADDDENEYTEKKKSSRQSMPRTIQQKKKPTTVKQRLLARIEKPPKRH